ncbi:hypothetical protein N658DRAFT_543497 [Parathielavia hyrcaniae]|uniref:Uncharacterized protein n=1 Tax=Parathielavia hyrcaniae TaxID=113614 RepID=A0AAN6SZS7_9PEZI|nr:hypothetical protein N658DRAFT_543497 [Parathielavia hyrcaniae]
MDYTRQSSQPATVDLVRADLAEIWTIDESEAEFPKKPPSISAMSDMLDFEYIPTPKVHTSKASRKDPLPDILGDFLKTSPTRKERRSDNRGKRAANKPSTKQNKQSHSQDSTASFEESIPINHSCSPADPASPSQSARKQRHSSDLPAASSAARKGSAEPSKQTKTVAEPANLASARSKSKVRKQDDGVFDLSDGTDSEAEARPKKRQAKQTASKKPPAPCGRTSQTAERNRAPPVAQSSKTARTSKKTTNKALEKPKFKHEMPILNTDGHGKQGTVQEAELEPHDYRSTSPESSLAKSDSGRETPMDQQAPTIQAADPAELISPRLKKTSPVAPRGCMPVIPDPPTHREVIILSSESPEASKVGAGSTSPFFVEKDQEQPIESPAAAAALELSPNGEASPTRLRMVHRRHGFTPPPSFQPRALGNNAAISPTLNTNRPLPANIREAFFSDERPAMSSSPSVHPLEPGLGNGVLNPEDIWSQAVQDDSPPAILHRIVSLLHRSLKPREEVVRDIVADYEENAFRLLDSLSGRHGQERTETLLALKQASRAAFSVFSGAGHDMAVFINKLRDMDVNHTASALARPVLAQKLDTVARLSQAKLGSYVRDEPSGGDAASEADDGPDVLTETYRLKLLDVVQRPDQQVSTATDGVDMRVDDFIKRYLQGETRKTQHPEVSQLEKQARNADEALEVLLDGILGTMKESRGGVSLSSG